MSSLLYNQFCEYSDAVLDSHMRDDIWPLYANDWVPENITIVMRLSGDFLENLTSLMLEFEQYFPDQFVYNPEWLHTTIAFFRTPLEGYTEQDFLEVVGNIIRRYKDSMIYEFLGCLTTPAAEGVVWMLMPDQGWKEKFIADMENELWIKQTQKYDDPIIITLRQKMAWMCLMKYKVNPSKEQVDYIKSLKHRSLGIRRPSEILIYKTKSSLLNNAQLLWSYSL